ncbi:hypothetical protein MKX03_016168 [Papaver bracteatum]|nr:hypothetical protein MKX03_016168 [Papaver bracteatum]
MVNKALQSVVVPDAMSGKVCQGFRRSKRLVNKIYTLREASLCGSKGGVAPEFDGNRESTNSGSSNDDLVLEAESFDDISSGGPPSHFLNLNVVGVPSDDNISAARNDFLPPGCKETTRDNGEKVVQSTFQIGSSFNLHVLSDHGLLGSGSTSPRLASEKARVRLLQSRYLMLTREWCISLLQSRYLMLMVETRAAQDPPTIPIPAKPVDFLSIPARCGCGVVVLTLMRYKKSRLESKNTELFAAIRVLPEELAGARQELANSKSRELQLLLYLEEIKGVLPDSWEY